MGGRYSILYMPTSDGETPDINNLGPDDLDYQGFLTPTLREYLLGMKDDPPANNVRRWRGRIRDRAERAGEGYLKDMMLLRNSPEFRDIANPSNPQQNMAIEWAGPPEDLDPQQALDSAETQAALAGGEPARKGASAIRGPLEEMIERAREGEIQDNADILSVFDAGELADAVTDCIESGEVDGEEFRTKLETATTS